MALFSVTTYSAHLVDGEERCPPVNVHRLTGVIRHGRYSPQGCDLDTVSTAVALSW